MAVNVERLRKAVVGAYVADVATMPLHWIYDNTKLRELLGISVDTPEFFDPPSCPFYNSSEFPGHYGRSQPSPYGESGLFTLEYLAEKDDMEADNYINSLYTYLKKYTGRLDQASKHFVVNYESGRRYPDVGAADREANSFPAVAPLVARYGGTSLLTAKTSQMARARQNDDFLVDVIVAMALLLERIASGQSIVQAVSEVKLLGSSDVCKAIERAAGGTDMSTYDFLMAYGVEANQARPGGGLGCDNPQAMMGVIHVLLTSQSYEEGIRSNILVGGDNAGRASLIGAVLAAIHGVPDEWVAKAKDVDHVEHLLDKVISHRPSSEQ